MKHLYIFIAMLFFSLSSCNSDSVSPVDELMTRMNEKTDSVNAPCISFELEDTTLIEEIEEINLHTQEWDGEPMDID